MSASLPHCSLTLPVRQPPALAADGGYSPELTNDPSVPACQVFSTEEIAEALGGPAEVRESYGTDTDVGLCSWQNDAQNAFVSVTYLPPGSQGLPEGKEREAFDFYAESQKAQFEPGQYEPASGIGDAAWATNLEGNEQEFYAVEFIKGSTTLTINSNGIGLDATIQLAKAASARL